MRLSSLIPLVLLLLVAGCATTLEDPLDKLPADQLYNQAKEALEAGDYQTAIDAFEKLEARFPFGKYAQQAQLEIAYAYYKFEEPDSAIATIDRFMRNNPGHPHLDYALYLRGLVNYNRGSDILDRFVDRKPSERDTRALRESFNDFTRLIKQYPDSKYAEDARKRVIFLHNSLAEYEINVANYYMKRGAWVAAVNRARYVIENYQRTPAAQEALKVLVRAYTRLGMQDLARDAQRVLDANIKGQ
ncbi:MAG TPA: outer membrane protein assembly factor BamD [Gammaproteobacteria bacterium]|nr:outer membrane protein assembly factor BamD [Gammaproteobacteria bacterium]